MLKNLEERATKIRRPSRFRLGDIVAVYNRYNKNYLLHTGVYIGRGKWLHQAGHKGDLRVESLRSVLWAYPGKKSFYRRIR